MNLQIFIERSIEIVLKYGKSIDLHLEIKFQSARFSQETIENNKKKSHTIFILQFKFLIYSLCWNTRVR